MTNLGDKIKERRIELGMSQDELAEKMGYRSRSTIAKIEKGVNDVVQSNVEKFAEVLKTTPAYLMGWEKSVEDNPVGEANKLADLFMRIELKEDVIVMLEEYEHLDESKKEQVREYVHFLSGRN